MMLDVLTELPDFNQTEWTPASLYEVYAQMVARRCRETDVIKPIDKHRFMEDIAWDMIRESKFDQDADANLSTSITELI